jgi:hypothetical protein
VKKDKWLIKYNIEIPKKKKKKNQFFISIVREKDISFINDDPSN